MPIMPTQAQLELIERIAEENPKAMKPDGFEAALIGIARRHSKPPQLAFDVDRCVQILVERDGMSYDDAMEFLEFNTFCAWVGEDSTPIFVETYDGSGEHQGDLKRVLDVLNEMWSTIPENKRPRYEEFNTFYRCFTQNLVQLERRENEVGLVNKGSGVVGISTLSFIATLTDLLVGKRLAAQVEDDNVISGWAWYEAPGGAEDDGDPLALELLE